MTGSLRRSVVLGIVSLVLFLVGAQVAVGQWSMQSIPNPPGGGELLGISCVSGSSCIAVGRRFSPTGLGPIGLAESWDGTQWSYELVPKPSGAELDGVTCLSSTNCIAVGSNEANDGDALVESWNGTGWKVVSNPDSAMRSQLNAVSCASRTSCTAVGFYNVAGGTKRVLVEHWNGRRWKVQPNPVTGRHHESDLDGVSCPSLKACTAVGSYGNNPESPLVERWNGTDWKVQRTGDSAGNLLLSVSCATRMHCAAVGGSSLRGRREPFAENRDGSTWSIEPSASPSNTTGRLNGVSCLSRADCIAVGGGPLAERWDGMSWATQPVPGPAGKMAVLAGVSCPSAHQCVAVGDYVGPDNAADYRPLAEMETS